MATACKNGHVSIVRLLLVARAAINVQSKRSLTPPFAASVNGPTEVVDHWIRHGCIVDRNNGLGHTPLHAACCNAHEAVVNWLLATGASLTLEDSQGLSAMDYATEPRHAAVRPILQQRMDAGAPCTQLAAV